jgi:hypothetical protein
MGYSLLFKYLMYRSDQQLTIKADHNQFNQSDVMLVKIPMHLPYYSNSVNYERCDGEVEVNGVHYNYIQRKIDNDTVYLVCQLNQTKTRLYKEKNAYTKLLNDIPSGKKSTQSASVKKSFASEYDSGTAQYSVISKSVSPQQKRSTETSFLADGHEMKTYPPPDLVS